MPIPEAKISAQATSNAATCGHPTPPRRNPTAAMAATITAAEAEPDATKKYVLEFMCDLSICPDNVDGQCRTVAPRPGRSRGCPHVRP